MRRGAWVGSWGGVIERVRGGRSREQGEGARQRAAAGGSAACVTAGVQRGGVDGLIWRIELGEPGWRAGSGGTGVWRAEVCRDELIRWRATNRPAMTMGRPASPAWRGVGSARGWGRHHQRQREHPEHRLIERHAGLDKAGVQARRGCSTHRPAQRPGYRATRAEAGRSRRPPPRAGRWRRTACCRRRSPGRRSSGAGRRCRLTRARSGLDIIMRAR